jgi:hypothetical protein
MKEVIPAAELAPQYRHGDLSARLASRRHREGKGKTWHLFSLTASRHLPWRERGCGEVRHSHARVNTFHDSSSRERFKIAEMRKIARGLPFP